VARAICLRQLTMAPRTRGQLAKTLRSKGVPEDVAAAVLDRLSEVGLIDDVEFANSWVRSRHAGRGLARRALTSELRARGVEADVVRDAVEGLGTGDELATARALVARKLPGMRRLDSTTRIRRLAGMLGRKGYPGGVAMQAIREAVAHDEALSRAAEL
jgi:regulatory protein